MVLEIQFRSVNYTLVTRICKNFNQSKAVLAVVFKAKAVYIVLKSMKRFESHSTQQHIIFQHYYQSYCDYLLKMGRMDEDYKTSRSGVTQH